MDTLSAPMTGWWMECRIRVLIGVSMDSGRRGGIGERALKRVAEERCTGSGTVSLSAMEPLRLIIAWGIHIPMFPATRTNADRWRVHPAHLPVLHQARVRAPAHRARRVPVHRVHRAHPHHLLILDLHPHHQILATIMCRGRGDGVDSRTSNGCFDILTLLLFESIFLCFSLSGNPL